MIQTGKSKPSRTAASKPSRRKRTLDFSTTMDYSRTPASCSAAPSQSIPSIKAPAGAGPTITAVRKDTEKTSQRPRTATAEGKSHKLVIAKLFSVTLLEPGVGETIKDKIDWTVFVADMPQDFTAAVVSEQAEEENTAESRPQEEKSADLYEYY